MLVPMSDLTELRDRMRAFSAARDWDQFHDPKSLALALVGEVGELAELLQWLPADQAADRACAQPLATRLGEELADVLIYLVQLADALAVDLDVAVPRKIGLAEAKYPVRDVRGVAPDKAGDCT
jgi:NTP pyrophosphatase (non-canonical NTP hydrolase)